MIYLTVFACEAVWNSYNNSCYYVSTVVKNQTDARDHCLSLGGDLVSVEDDAEMNYIANISYVLQPSYAWFPPFRCRSSLAVSPFCRCKISLFFKNYARKFRSVKRCSHCARHRTTALDALTHDVGRQLTCSKKIRNGSGNGNGNGVRKRQRLKGTAKR